jgi:hypothetical protein
VIDVRLEEASWLDVVPIPASTSTINVPTNSFQKGSDCNVPARHMGTRIRWVIGKTVCVPSRLSDPCKATRNMSGDHFTVYVSGFAYSCAFPKRAAAILSTPSLGLDGSFFRALQQETATAKITSHAKARRTGTAN